LIGEQTTCLAKRFGDQENLGLLHDEALSKPAWITGPHHSNDIARDKAKLRERDCAAGGRGKKEALDVEEMEA